MKEALPPLKRSLSVGCFPIAWNVQVDCGVRSPEFSAEDSGRYSFTF